MGSRPSAFTLTKPGPFRLYSTVELLRMPPPTWQIKPILPAGGFVGLVGPPGMGKTFVALDLALSVATGTLWQGCEVQRGYVLYISAEGGMGIGKRVRAWLQDRDIHPREAHIAWMTEAIDVHNESDGMEALIERVASEIDRQPSLVIIDTLARCFDGNENEQEDMGRFVKGVDKLRVAFQSTVIVVHHTRLDGERERGNTAFRGAADTMMFVNRGSNHAPIDLTCAKQKDAEPFEDLSLKLKVVPDTDSCAIAMGRGNTLAQNHQQILDILVKHGPQSWDDWSSLAKSLGVAKTTFSRYLVGLKANGKIVKKNGLYSVVSGKAN